MTHFMHQTDLFHPHGDPDDHWDLATVYALAMQGSFQLRGIILDYPPDHRMGDPATIAMAQLGRVTGVVGVPFVIGTQRHMRHRQDAPRSDAPDADLAAAQWLCRALQDSPEPVVINIVGSCTDVAIAGLMRPDLFKTKCRAVYLNAGSAHTGAEGTLEYNVRLNPGAYAAIFDLPCAVFWCPCWHRTERQEVGPNGTWYSFAQGGVFSHLSEPMCNFFIYMLSRSSDPKYLRYLAGPPDSNLKTNFGQQQRSMWSTAAILHAAGMGVDASNGLLPSGCVNDPVFDFVPAEVTCGDDGRTTWRLAGGNTGRFIFNIRRPDIYPAAMTSALCKLLGGIGKTDTCAESG